MLGLALAALHLLSLAAGVLSLTQRARALALAERNDQLKPVFFWDAVYGLVAIVWLGSGLWRAFGGVEKGTDYYLTNHAFWTKMLLLLVLLVIEGYLAATFVRWRILLKKNQPVSLERKARLVRFHYAEFWLVLGMVTMAALMARGVGVVKPKPAVAAPDRAELLRTGEGVYRRYCVTCHQVDGRGRDGKLAADFHAAGRLARPDSELGAIVRNGVPGTAMRAFQGELDDSEIQGVVAYVRERYGRAAAP